ncbi:hypothetical protein GGI43DRAFT_388737 [Trichoderma evansii]
MHSNTAILALVASASAVDLLPRATPNAKCATEVLSLVANLPTAAPALASALIAHPPTDSCKVDLPSSLSADYSSYTDQLVSWYTSNSAEIFSLASDCSVGSLTNIIPSCSSTAAPAAAPTGKGGNSTVPTAPSAPKSTKSSTAGSARETGMGFAALAAAGLAAIL